MEYKYISHTANEKFPHLFTPAFHSTFKDKFIVRLLDNCERLWLELQRKGIIKVNSDDFYIWSISCDKI